MLSSIAFTTLRRAAPIVLSRAHVARAASARYAAAATTRYASAKPFAVDAPDGGHDLQDVEESNDWAKRAVDVASATEDADAITEMHDAVLGETLFAVDAPDGEHDMEDVEEHMMGVNKIIDEASLFENVEEVREQQKLRKETLKHASRTTEHDC
eukprot:107191_1